MISILEASENYENKEMIQNSIKIAKKNSLLLYFMINNLLDYSIIIQ